MAVLRDIAEGDLTTENGVTSHTRTFYVTELARTGPAYLQDAQRTAGVREGDPHPVIASATARRIIATPAASGVVAVRVTYRTPTQSERQALEGQGTVSWSVEPISESTYRDANGTPMRTVFVYNVSAIAQAYYNQLHRIEVDRFLAIARVSRVLDTDAREFNRQYAGHVNVAPWAGFKQWRVLCRGFTSEPRSDGLYDVTGTFAVAPIRTVGSNVVHSDWRSAVLGTVQGVIPLNAKLGGALELYLTYPQVDLVRSGFVA